MRLLTRTPRALWLAIFAPAGLLALRLGRISHPGAHSAAHSAAGSPRLALVAGHAVFGLLNTAFLTHAAGLVAARQDGVLRRWRLSPLPADGYFAGRSGSQPPSGQVPGPRCGRLMAIRCLN